MLSTNIIESSYGTQKSYVMLESNLLALSWIMDKLDRWFSSLTEFSSKGDILISIESVLS